MISSLPVIIIGMFSYFKASGEIQHNANASKTLQLGQIQNSVEQVLKTADFSLSNFVSSALVGQTLNEPIVPQQFQLYNEIRQELTHLQTFDTGITDIVLLSTESGWFINNVGLYRLHQAVGKDDYLKFFDLPLDSAWIAENSDNQPRSFTRCQSLVRLVKKLPLNSPRKKGLAVSEIPVCHLGKMFTYDKENESVLIADRDNQIFLHANPLLLGAIDLKQSVFSRIAKLPEQAGQFRLTGGNTDFSVTYRKSDYNGWTYLSFIDIKELTKQSRAIGWFTAATCIGLLVLALIAAWVFSQRFNSPIEKLFKFAFSTFQPEKPGKDGFEFITRQIHKVLDTNARLENNLQSQIEQLKVLFMLKLFRGDLGAKEIEHRLYSLGYDRHWTTLSLVTIQIDTLEGTRYDNRDMDLLLFAMNNMMEEIVPPHRRLTPIVIDQTQATAVACNSETEEGVQEELYPLAQNIQQTISRYLHLSVSVGISLPYRDAVHTQHAYQESLEALKNRIRLGDRTIIFFRDLPLARSPLHTFFPSKVQGELSDAIKLADRDKAVHLLQAFFRELSKKQLGPKEYEIWTARLLIDFVQLTHTLGIPYLPFMDNQSIFEQLFKWRSPREIQDWLRYSVIEPIIVAVEERTQTQYKKISEQIIQIIHEDFDKDISLEWIAGKLHYNANYISSVFRKETGISFSEYLAMHRHSKALKYLLDTDMSIKDISNKLQYNNSQNFIRSFRKTEGMTPGQYRELHAGK